VYFSLVSLVLIVLSSFLDRSSTSLFSPFHRPHPTPQFTARQQLFHPTHTPAVCPTTPYSVSNTNTLVTTHPPAVPTAFSFANPSHSYLPLFLISHLFNRFPLLSSFLAVRYPYLTSTIYRPPSSSTFTNPFSIFLEECHSFFLSLLPRLTNSSSPVTSTFIVIISRIT